MNPSSRNPNLGLDGLENQLPGGAASILTKTKTTSSKPVGPSPWDNLAGKDRFFFPITIEGDRWNKLFPYRLVVIDTAKGNKIVNGPNDNSSITIKNAGSNGDFTIAFTALNNQWQIQLPITPEQLSISDQFAISTTATLRGILEEHNGVRFKNINASGTFGVWPSRHSVTQPPGSPSIVQSLFGGTIEAFGNVTGSIQRAIRTATTGHPASKPVTTNPEQSGDGMIASTGYYQALFLEQFLEQYAQAKKRPENASWRLVFDLPKQNQSYIVTPMQFVWQQNASKALQINYTMQFKAWRRIDLQQNVVSAAPSIQPLTPGLLQRVLATIAAARQVCSQSLNLIQAVRSDVEAPLEALRQTALFTKDLAGTAIAAADLPFQLQRDFKSAINDFATQMNFNGLAGAAGTSDAVKGQIADLKSSSKKVEGLSITAVSGGQLGNAASNAQSIDPSSNVFSNPEANFALLNQVPLNSLVLNTAQQAAVNNAIEDVRALTIDDFRQFRATILQLALQLSNNFGTGDAFYSQVYNQPPPLVRTAPITLDDYEILDSLYQTLQSYDILTASTQIDDSTRPSNMEYVAGLAQTSGIPFNIPNSMILAPVPFGLTIEAISQRYLGDTQRWLEIVTLNNLRDPYIDEDGFQRALLSNATGRQITISDITNLFLGQRVILQSSTQIPSARQIIDIAKLSDTSFLISLDGEPNLDNFLLVDGAYLQAYLPGTVNSQQKIFIPSDLSVPDDPHIVVPASTSVDPLTGMSKVDLLLTDDGDLAVNNFGDFRYSYGMTNIVQALKIKFGTIAGTVLLHPEFGLGVKPGTINGSVDAQQIYSSINKMIQQDPRFSGVTNLQISLVGPTLTINLAVILANQRGVFPITFKVTS